MRKRLTDLSEMVAGVMVVAGVGLEFGIAVGLMVAGVMVGFLSWLVGE